jgi:hypothetical protein
MGAAGKALNLSRKQRIDRIKKNQVEKNKGKTIR